MRESFCVFSDSVPMKEDWDADVLLLDYVHSRMQMRAARARTTSASGASSASSNPKTYAFGSPTAAAALRDVSVDACSQPRSVYDVSGVMTVWVSTRVPEQKMSYQIIFKFNWRCLSFCTWVSAF